MGLDTGHASPIPTSGGEGETGHASPIPSGLGFAGGESGHASPIVYEAEDLPLPVTLWRAFQSQDNYDTFGFDPAYSADGGELCEAHAAWPTSGPYLAQLVGQDSVVYPGASEGCYGGVPGLADALYTNASGQILRFAIPRVPQGTYDLKFTWADGETTQENALRIVPRQVPRATHALLRAPVLGPWLERR